MIRRTKLLASVHGAKLKSWLPVGFTELEYIKSSGEQWINTGLKCNHNSVITSYHQAVNGRILGNTSVSGGKVCLVRTSTFIYLNFGSAYTYPNWLPTQNTAAPELIVCTSDGLEVNGVHCDWIGTVGEFESDELAIFTAAPSLDCGVLTLYYVTMVINDIEHNFLPVLDRDGVPCLYNPTTSLCYYNSGTGEFEYALKS